MAHQTNSQVLYLPGVDDGAANRNYCIATYHYCNSPNCYNDEVDCMQVPNMMDTLDMSAVSNDSHMLLDIRVALV